MSEWTDAIHQALLKPFPDEYVEWRENRFAYVEARAVMARLDEAVGFGNWSFRCEVIPHQLRQVGAVVKGSLTILGVTREDCGEHWRASEKDRVEVYKSAVSDALKRCAVHFGVGRYLYELEVKRAGQMTAAERDAAAKKAGYNGAGAETGGNNGHAPQPAKEQSARAPQNLSVAEPDYFCVKCNAKIQPAGNMDPAGVANLSVQIYGRILCIPCGRAESKALAGTENLRVPEGKVAA